VRSHMEDNGSGRRNYLTKKFSTREKKRRMTKMIMTISGKNDSSINEFQWERTAKFRASGQDAFEMFVFIHSFKSVAFCYGPDKMCQKACE
jgi:hypothetical protein